MGIAEQRQGEVDETYEGLLSTIPRRLLYHRVAMEAADVGKQKTKKPRGSGKGHVGKRKTKKPRGSSKGERLRKELQDLELAVHRFSVPHMDSHNTRSRRSKTPQQHPLFFDDDDESTLTDLSYMFPEGYELDHD
jgi:hypothetical protein